ncbi:class E sortase [Streptomyces hygroscopicus subsp. hygroscopicus]|uniref:class E sortase n=1 Tax=Streptomyces hygroscopicus TaxID=1912 RepID=UPI001C65AF36|nr:class E sortase [Streptomyces hygroscopicus subsp. hygroscopicus]
MTGPRPEREGVAQGAREPAPYAPYGAHEPYDAQGGHGSRSHHGGHGGYGGSDAFAAAVEGLRDPLADPLSDPLTDPQAEPLPGSAPAGPTGRTVGTASLSVPPPTGRRRRARPAATGPEEAAEAARPPTGRRRARAAPTGPSGPVHAAPAPVRAPEPSAPTARTPGRRGPETAPPRSAGTSRGPDADETAVLPPVTARGDETAVLPPVTARGDETAVLPPVAAQGGETVVLRAVGSQPAPADQTMPLRKVEPDRAAGPEPVPGGRAARRKAAQGAGKRARRHGPRARGGTAETGAPGAAGGARAAGAAPPRTRMEAKRAARARKDSPGAVVSRVVGELFITLGVVMLLFVTYQLWWTNIRAHQQANGAANNLQKKWDENGDDRDPGAFSPGQGFAIIYIPKLDVKAPIAEGIDKHKVLDRGMVGHYGKNPLKTAMPWDKKGNFALAGHRNTHGEPFRYINRLKPGDKIVVETQNRYYTYEMSSILPQTPPSNTGVIKPVPPGSGFTGPGRYITLTTCTPEFTSTYRMIVWGKMVEERPRSEGKPDALVG